MWESFIYYIQLLATMIWTNLESVSNVAMNILLAMALWTLRDDACSDVWTSADTLAAIQREWGNSVQPLKKPTQLPPIPTARWISFPYRKFISELPTAVQDGAVTSKGSHRMEDGPIFQKTSVPHSLMTTYRRNLCFQTDPSRWTVSLSGWDLHVCKLTKN